MKFHQTRITGFIVEQNLVSKPVVICKLNLGNFPHIHSAKPKFKGLRYSGILPDHRIYNFSLSIQLRYMMKKQTIKVENISQSGEGEELLLNMP